MSATNPVSLRLNLLALCAGVEKSEDVDIYVRLPSPPVSPTPGDLYNVDLHSPTRVTNLVETVAHDQRITPLSPTVNNQQAAARIVDTAIKAGGTVNVIVPDKHDSALEGIAKVVVLEVDGPEKEDNSHLEADERRSVRKERLWIFIDTFGTIRNTVATTSTSIKMSGSVVAAAALPALSATVGGMAAVGGLAIIFSALFDNLPDVKKEIEEAIEKKDAEKLYLATISIFTSVVFYAGFGVGLTGMGVSMLFTPDVASGLFHASYGTELAKTVATGFGDYFLGSLCIARGSLMGGRAIYNMTQLGSFDKGFYQALRNGKVGDFLRAEYDDHKGHFHRMAGNSEELKSWINEGMQGEPPRAVLEDIDKHLFRQQYIQKLVLIISILMIIGGICAICVGGGLLAHLALLPLTLTTNLTGTMMEFYYCHYDSSSWLDSRIAKAYEESRKREFDDACQSHNEAIARRANREEVEARRVTGSLIGDEW